MAFTKAISTQVIVSIKEPRAILIKLAEIFICSFGAAFGNIKRD